jgi:hypothetical protein
LEHLALVELVVCLTNSNPEVVLGRPVKVLVGLE